jgi:hypothetical protein
LQVHCAQTIMRTAEDKAALARAVLSATITKSSSAAIPSDTDPQPPAARARAQQP